MKRTKASTTIEDQARQVASAIRTSRSSFHEMFTGFLRQLIDEKKPLSDRQFAVLQKHLAAKVREQELLTQALNEEI